MKDWEDIIKERQLSRKAELPESDWNDFLSRKASHDLAVKRRRRFITAAISVPAAAAVLLLLFLMPFKTVVPDNQISQNEQSESQITTDSLANEMDSITIEKPQVEIVQVKPEVKPESKPVDSRMVVRNTSSVKGRIYDFDSAEPMYLAAVMIYQIDGADSTYIGGTSTDENGEFVIGNLMPGNYVASTRFMGYDDADRNFTIRPGEELSDIGRITIKGGMPLSEIAVNAVVAKVQMINDTVMFNSAAYKLPEGASAEDLIRKLPGVQIDSTGNITVNGKSISRILVNGKEFFARDTTKNLTQLTAEMIEKVKAYEKNSDLSRQTGIDDGREETVLDLDVRDVRKVRRGDGRNRRHRYVDMGLSVKWATCNVGADKPEDFGDYYAWGETESKSEYLLSNYRFSKWFISDETNDSTMLLTKYCNNAGYGYDGLVDNKTVLDPEDDVAHVKWGGDWRIPTIEEWNELKENCTWTWGNMNGVYGFYVTSNMPGYTDHSIFLPAAGLSAHKVTGVSSSIDYVSSSLYPYSNQFECYSASFTKARFVPYGCVFRYLGLSVRPVCN